MATMSKTMDAALESFRSQVASGEGADLSTEGMRYQTIIALRDRGFVRLEGSRCWTDRNHRSGRIHYHRTFTVVWEG